MKWFLFQKQLIDWVSKQTTGDSTVFGGITRCLCSLMHLSIPLLSVLLKAGPGLNSLLIWFTTARCAPKYFRGRSQVCMRPKAHTHGTFSQEKCKIPKQGEQKKGKNHLMEENLQLLDCHYPYFCSSQHCWLFSLADIYGKKPEHRSVLVFLTEVTGVSCTSWVTPR